MKITHLSFQQRILTRLFPLLLSMVAIVHPASAGETRSAFIEERLASDFNFNATEPPTDGSEFRYQEYEVISHEFDRDLQTGEKRRVTGQLALSLDTTHPQVFNGVRAIPYAYAEVNNIVKCSYYNPETDAWEDYDGTSAGTNHPGWPGEVLTFSNSLLLKADKPGRYRCALVSYASHDRTSDFYATAHAQDTYLQVSAGDEAGAEQFTHAICNSRGDSNCEYLADYTIVDVDDPNSSQSAAGSEPTDPRRILITSEKSKTPDTGPNPDWIWSAADGATAIEVLGTYQVTSCPYHTASCIAWYWGPRSSWGDWAGEDHANIVSSVHFDQLYPDGSVCQANQSPDKRYAISNDTHHQPVNYRLSMPVSQTCLGSRRFRVGVEVKWESGNPLKIDGGTITVINAVRNDSATVPNISGVNRDQAIAILQANGFVPAIVGVVNPASIGLVLDQNAPAGTIEPLGSTVNVNVSLGSATIPDVVGDLEVAATRSVRAARLTLGTISRPNSCVDPGIVQSQSPAPGSIVALNTPVTLTIPSCVRKPGGGGGSPLPQ